MDEAQQSLFPIDEITKHEPSWRDGRTEESIQFVKDAERFVCAHKIMPQGEKYKMLVDTITHVKMGIWAVTFDLTPEELLHYGLRYFTQSEIILTDPSRINMRRPDSHPAAWAYDCGAGKDEIRFVVDAEKWVANTSKPSRKIVAKAIELVKEGKLQFDDPMSVEGYLDDFHNAHRTKHACEHCNGKLWQVGKPKHVIAFVHEAETYLDLIVNHETVRARELIILIFQVKEGYYVPPQKRTVIQELSTRCDRSR